MGIQIASHRKNYRVDRAEEHTGYPEQRDAEWQGWGKHRRDERP